jgi:transcriptional regulator with XRE-family HTH domain
MTPRPPESVVTFGHVVRTTRSRIRWTQRELARRSGVVQSRISMIERGLVDDVRISEIEAICSALRIEYRIDFRTPDLLARPADLVHARCSAHVDRRLSAQGFRIAREVEIGSGRIRGWIDLLAFDPATRLLVIVEIKTELADLGGLERALGWYERGARLAAAELRWRPRSVCTAVLVLHTAANDRLISANRGVLSAAFGGHAHELAGVLAGTVPSRSRYLAMIDPRSTRRRWIRPSRLDGSRLRAPYVDYVDAVRVLESGRS